MSRAPVTDLCSACPNPGADVALRAFCKWADRGQPTNTDLQDWREAEAELRDIQLLTEQLAALQKRVSDTLAEQVRVRRRLAAEHSVTRVLAFSSTLDDAASGILQSICDGQGWDIGVMWIIDREAHVLRCAAMWHSLPCDVSGFRQATCESVFAPGVGFPGRVWASQSPLSVGDFSKEPGLPRAAAATLGNLHGAIAFPIRNGADFLGVLEFFSQKVREPDPDDTEMMLSIGRQISQFVERRTAEALVLRDREERRVAGRIQQALLPRRPPVLDGFRIGGRCVSALDVGGDCFDFIPLLVDSEECLGVLVADASGHGVGAALRASETRAYVRALGMTCADVGHLLTLMNQRLADDPEAEGFVTAILLRLEPARRRLHYASAGHCTGFVLDVHGNVHTELTSTERPLGIDPTTRYSMELPISLQPGDLVLLFTDGVVEAPSDTGELFGTRRLLQVVRDCRDDLPDEIIEAVISAVQDFCGKHAPDDDLTVIVIKAESAVE